MLRLPKYYTLIGQTPVLCDNVLEWADAFEADRHVGDTIVGDYRVSTVFLGLDHNFSGRGDPVLFETMVFPAATVRLSDEWRAQHPDEVMSLAARIAIAGQASAGLDKDILEFQKRYCTWKDAEAHHEFVVAMIENRTGGERAPAAAGDNLDMAFRQEERR